MVNSKIKNFNHRETGVVNYCIIEQNGIDSIEFIGELVKGHNFVIINLDGFTFTKYKTTQNFLAWFNKQNIPVEWVHDFLWIDSIHVKKITKSVEVFIEGCEFLFTRSKPISNINLSVTLKGWNVDRISEKTICDLDDRLLTIAAAKS